MDTELKSSCNKIIVLESNLSSCPIDFLMTINQPSPVGEGGFKKSNQQEEEEKKNRKNHCK